MRFADSNEGVRSLLREQGNLDGILGGIGDQVLSGYANRKIAKQNARMKRSTQGTDWGGILSAVGGIASSFAPSGTGGSRFSVPKAAWTKTPLSSSVVDIPNYLNMFSGGWGS
jgi:hypothetical protein